MCYRSVRLTIPIKSCLHIKPTPQLPQQQFTCYWNHVPESHCSLFSIPI